MARYAPEHWRSTGSVIDKSYEALGHIARGARPAEAASGPGLGGEAESPLLAAPPPGLSLHAPDAATAERLRGREVWLVHPWALRAPPADLHTRDQCRCK